MTGASAYREPSITGTVLHNDHRARGDTGAVMNFQKWSLFIEITGAAAVVASLVVLVVQVNANTSAIQATTRDSVAERIEQRTVTVATSPQLAALLVRSQVPDGIEPGSPEEMQLVWLYASVLTSLEEAYLQFQAGNLAMEYLEPRARRGLRAIDGPTFRRYFAGLQENYTPGFLNWTRTILEQMSKQG